jgi:hypothetical protein
MPVPVQVVECSTGQMQNLAAKQFSSYEIKISPFEYLTIKAPQGDFCHSKCTHMKSIFSIQKAEIITMVSGQIPS